MAPAKKSIDDPSRQRVNMACAYCRYRKIKCCGSDRCANCIRTKRECVYVPVPDSSKADKAARKAANLERKRLALALTAGGNAAPAARPLSSPSPSEPGPIDMRTGLPISIGMKRKSLTTARLDSGSDEDFDDEADEGSDYEASPYLRADRRRSSVASIAIANATASRGRHDTTSNSSSASSSSEPHPLTPGTGHIDWELQHSPTVYHPHSHSHGHPLDGQYKDPLSPNSEASSLPSPQTGSRSISPDFSPHHSPTALTPFFPNVSLGMAHPAAYSSPDSAHHYVEREQATGQAGHVKAIESMRRPGLTRTASDPTVPQHLNQHQYHHQVLSPDQYQQAQSFPRSPLIPAGRSQHRASSSLGIYEAPNGLPRRMSSAGSSYSPQSHLGLSSRYPSPLQHGTTSQQQQLQAAAQITPSNSYGHGHRHSIANGYAFQSASTPQFPFDNSYSSSLPPDSHFSTHVLESFPAYSNYGGMTASMSLPHQVASYSSPSADPYTDVATPSTISYPSQASYAAPSNRFTGSPATAPSSCANGIALSPYNSSASADLSALLEGFEHEHEHVQGQVSYVQQQSATRRLSPQGVSPLDEGLVYYGEPVHAYQEDGAVGGLGLIGEFDTELSVEVGNDWHRGWTFPQ